MRLRAAYLSIFLLLPANASAFEWIGRLRVEAKELKNANPQRRRDAVQALAQHDIRDTKKFLLEALEDDDPTVRVEAARLLARHKVAEAALPIADWLGDFDKQSRITTAGLLGELGAA